MKKFDEDVATSVAGGVMMLCTYGSNDTSTTM
jgi:hypothetical protein